MRGKFKRNINSIQKQKQGIKSERTEHIYSFSQSIWRNCHNKNVSLNTVHELTTATMQLVTGHWQFLIVFTHSANADAHIAQL